MFSYTNTGRIRRLLQYRFVILSVYDIQAKIFVYYVVIFIDLYRYVQLWKKVD